MLSGKLKIKVHLNSRAFAIYQRREIEEEFTCNYELNPTFQSTMAAGGLRIAGLGENGEARIVELEDRHFFVATLFLPQLTSTKGKPHPLITAYLDAVLRFKGASQKARTGRA